MANPFERGLAGTQSGSAPMREPALGQPDTKLFDFLTGIPSAINGNPFEAVLGALTLIPGGAAAKGAARLAPEAFDVIKGGKTLAGEVFSNSTAKAANAAHEALKGKYGRVADVVSGDVLKSLPELGTSPKMWSEAQRKAVEQLRNQTNALIAHRSKVKPEDSLVRSLQALAMRYPKN